MNFMRLSSMKAAHVAVAWCRVQEIRASRSFFARCGIPPMLTASTSNESRVRGKELWNPTSREKRARYGAHPSFVREPEPIRFYFGIYVLWYISTYAGDKGYGRGGTDSDRRPDGKATA